MSKKVTVWIGDKTSVIYADTLVADDGFLYAYQGEELRGVYRQADITAAYRTE